jgi:ADP-L-glycero-D-manno-heptose 6-epimerase
MKKLLVTGYKGFIGLNLYNTLIDLGYTVIGIDDEYIVDDWKVNLLGILSSQKFDGIFHVGACSDTLEQDVNYMMVRNYETTKLISDFCLENKIPLIYSSSAANYGTNNLYPANLYGWSKYVAEQYVIKNNGIALRYFNVYGPNEHNKGKMSSLAYQSYIKHKNHEDIKLFPNKPKRDFVYIKDIVSANIFAFDNFNKNQGHYYEVGSGTANTFESVLDFMGIPYTYTDKNLIPNGYQFFTQSDNTLWMKGWTPQFQLEQGIKNYKKYLYEQH